ncbi:MAG: nitrilase-related carbon-nitrogen hydrolase, partial [Synergistaceae bacterium]|nr:nitrilase-related carbon-nitrogen hydrolase [Synergistaceae bacterium]
MKNNFENMYSHGFVRLAACIPSLRVSDPIYNAAKTIELSQEAYKQKAVLSIFPELGISAYSNEDLFFHDALQQ